MSSYAENYFFLNRWILCCIGIWPPDNKSKVIQFLYKAYAITVFVYVTMLFIATEIVSLLYTYKNEDALIKNLSMVVTHLGGAVKTVFFYLRGHEIIEMIKILESEQLRYEDCEENNFYPGDISKACKATIIKATLLCFLMPHAVLLVSYIPPTLATFSYIIKGNATVKLPTHLPYYSWIPFQIDTVGTFLMALAFQAGGMFGFGYSISGTDSIFVGLMHCISQNLAIIQGAFLTIRSRSLRRIKGPALAADRQNNSECLNAAMNWEMRRVCRNLQTIFKLCWDLEKIYKYVTLFQVVATLLILCTCLYLVSAAPTNSKQFYAEIVYLIAMGIQPFMYCWYGNEVTLKADEMSTYVYQCDWLRADTKFKKSLILTMSRLKKPVYLSAGNFAPLTLATFVGVVKGSYSFFTFLNNTKK